jgi:HEAT repeat protein
MALFGPPNVEKMKAKKDVTGLIKALGYRKDASVRKAAVKALVEIGEPAVEPLIAALKVENEDVRQAAAEALVKNGEPAVEPLIAALKDYSVREAAAGVLGKIGEPAVERAVERLIVEFMGQDDDAREAAVKALVAIGEPSVEPLIAALSDKSLNARRIVGEFWVVMPAGTEEVIPHCRDLCAKLIDVLRDKGLSARGAAAGALGDIGDTRAIEPLIAAVKDEDLLVRWTAAGALFALRDARALEPLATLKDEDLLVQGCGLVLKLVGDARTVKPLIAKLVDEDDDVRLAATEVLAKLDWKPA